MGSALVVIDMLSAYDFPDADTLAENARDVVPVIAALVARAQADDVPVIYVNDNYGDWNSSAEELLQRALGGEQPELVEPLRPPDGAAFVIKARHTIFYGTPLDHLIATEEIDRLVLVGQVTEQCVFYSALDAHVRGLDVAVPPDAVAYINEDWHRAALEMMEANMGADVTPSADCRLRE
jgi:nicotinamidase-related amidase